MNIEELAQVFDGISKGLGAALKEKEKKELVALASMFQRFPNQSITDFIKFVEGSFSKERNSIPALIERMKAIQQGNGEPVSELESSIASLGATELKKLIVALGMKASGKKDENLRILRNQFAHGAPQAANHIAEDLSNEVANAFRQYEGIKADLRGISVEEMRARSSVFSTMSKSVLAGLLAKLGYPAIGSKEDLEAKLRDNLTSIKISFDQTSQIGSR